jgi:hypothetical protein
MTVVWSFQYEVFGNKTIRLAFHKKSDMAENLVQLNLDFSNFLNFCSDSSLVQGLIRV